MGTVGGIVGRRRPGPAGVAQIAGSRGSAVWMAVLRLDVDGQSLPPLFEDPERGSVGRHARPELRICNLVQPSPSARRLAISRPL